MNDIVIWFITITTFICGYVMGSRSHTITQEVQKKIVDIIGDKPTPGVVNHLTEEQIAEKHDPKKRGNLEAFNKLAQTLGWKK